MKRLSYNILVGLQLVGTWVTAAQTDTGHSGGRQGPVILANGHPALAPGNDHTTSALAISSRALDFGSVSVGSVKELSFTVRNVGGGIVTGEANVSAPFNILGGSPYLLKDPQAQIITVRYAPKSIGIHMAVVHLTDGAAVTVMGSAARSAHRAPARRRAPTDPPGLRMIASN